MTSYGEKESEELLLTLKYTDEHIFGEYKTDDKHIQVTLSTDYSVIYGTSTE